MTTPAIVLKTQFTLPKTKGPSFKNFIKYIDRKDTRADENSYGNYQNYMSNKEKSTGLFTNEHDSLDVLQKKKVQEVMNKAQKDGSIMWQDVISFDNEWLKEAGILQTRKGEPFLDETKLKQATRNAVNRMWQNEGIADSIYWTAAIHYNTDNIHIHVASVQTREFRERGKRKPRTLDIAKSAVAHTLDDRTVENKKLNEFIRDKVIVSMKKNHVITSAFDFRMVAQFKSIYKRLPDDKRTWKYNMNAMKDIRPDLDKLTDMYLSKHFQKEFERFKKDLDKEVAFYKRTYGDNSRAEKFRESKMKDLYTRCGNTILSEMRLYNRQLTMQASSEKYNKQRLNFEANRAANQALYRMNRLMNDNMEHIRNQREFERLQYEQEMNR